MKKTSEIIPRVNVKQSITFNPTQSYSLSILQMNSMQLLHHLKKVMAENPYFQYCTNHEIKPEKEWYIQQEASLQQDLYMQLHTMSLPIPEAFSEFMIQSLDENGFLSMEHNEYCRLLHMSPTEFDKQLRMLQGLEPAGVFAKNSVDAIRIQLEQDHQDFALNIYQNYQKELIQHAYSKLADSLQVSVEDIELAVDIIREQNPFPCINYGNISEIIYPDIEIQIKNGDLQIRPVNIIEGTFTDYTAPLMADSVIRNYFSQAKILMEDINRRNRTLLLIANELCKFQKAFFLDAQPLVQCRLHDIVDSLGIHISTVSRCIKNKYYMFQNHIYPLRHLLLTSAANNQHNPYVKSIKALLAKENKNEPYTDYELYLLLRKENLDISRRTVTKYRNKLNIPPANKRKDLYKQAHAESK